MEDNSGKIKVSWSIGKGKIPNGPDFSNTIGTIYLDSFRWDQISIPKGSSGPGKKFPLDKQSDTVATIVLIRAIPDDNGGADIYKYLKYQLGDEPQTHTDFGESPLMLIGSVATLVSKYQGITIWYNPDDPDNSKEGAGKATTPQPPKEATISILVGVRASAKNILVGASDSAKELQTSSPTLVGASDSAKELQTSSPTAKKSLRLNRKQAKKTVGQL
jgi:hypothetical protein